MANPYHHAVSSVRRWGGTVEDYLPIHRWFDATKELHGDFRHRALRHHTQGVFECERKFGVTIVISTGRQCRNCAVRAPLVGEFIHRPSIMLDPDGCDDTAAVFVLKKEIPTRWVAEQHVVEDLGWLPTLGDWLKAIKPEPWMNRSRALSRELEVVEDKPSPPDPSLFVKVAPEIVDRDEIERAEANARVTHLPSQVLDERPPRGAA